MPIAMIFEAFPSPSETFLRREVEALRAQGVDVRAFAWRASQGTIALPPSTSAASRIARRLQPRSWWRKEGASWARAWKSSGDFSIEHIHAAWASFPAAWASGAAHELGVSWSFAGHARDLWVEGRDLPRKLASAAFATSCTQSGVQLLREQSPRPEKVLFAPHGLPLDEWQWRDARVFDAGRPLQILSVGRLVEKKGFNVLLQALSAWKSDASGEIFHAQIIGAGPQRGALERQRDALHLEEHVDLRGARDSGEVRAAMQKADVLVLPCRVARDGDRDGLPNVLLEAAAIGLPLVVGDAGSVRDFCVPEGALGNSRLFPSQDALALSHLLRAAWRELQEPNSSWQQDARRARDLVEREFDINSTVQVLADALRHSMANGRQ